MGEIFAKAIAALEALPPAERERISWEIIERLEDKGEWDRIVGSPPSRRWLEKTTEAVLKTYAKRAKRLSRSLIFFSSDEFLRGDAYWQGFDALPQEVRKLAEANYRLWQENPTHPSLRFKQIHPEIPVFSFRVGMRHRTVGIRAPDEKIVWFWIGSFQQYEEMIAQP